MHSQVVWQLLAVNTDVSIQLRSSSHPILRWQPRRGLSNSDPKRAVHPTHQKATALAERSHRLDLDRHIWERERKPGSNSSLLSATTIVC